MSKTKQSITYYWKTCIILSFASILLILPEFSLAGNFSPPPSPTPVRLPPIPNPSPPAPLPIPTPNPSPTPVVPVPTPGSGNTTLDNTLCKVVNTLTGRTGKAVAVIGVFFLGIGLFLGKMSWATALAVGLGISAIFGADTVIQWIGGSGASGPGCNGGGTGFTAPSPLPGQGVPTAPPRVP